MSADHVFKADESRLQFTFGSEWGQVIGWDNHEANTKGLKQKIDGMKSVDFLGLLHNGEPWFIEVKNFRKFRIENRYRLENEGEALMKEAADKVRSSFASLIWACGRETTSTTSVEHFVQGILEWKKKVVVVVWLEQDMPLRPEKAIAYQAQLKKELRWLKPDVRIQHPHAI